MPKQSPASTRRARSDSITGQRVAMQASTIPEPPQLLTGPERVYFDAAVTSRELATWTPNDLHIACHYARTCVQLDTAQREAKEAPNVIKTNTGNLRQHPALLAVAMYARLVKDQASALGLTAHSRQLTGAAQGRRNEAEAAARKTIEQASKAAGGLLAD